MFWNSYIFLIIKFSSWDISFSFASLFTPFNYKSTWNPWNPIIDAHFNKKKKWEHDIKKGWRTRCTLKALAEDEDTNSHYWQLKSILSGVRHSMLKKTKPNYLLHLKIPKGKSHHIVYSI